MTLNDIPGGQRHDAGFGMTQPTGEPGSARVRWTRERTNRWLTGGALRTVLETETSIELPAR